MFQNVWYPVSTSISFVVSSCHRIYSPQKLALGLIGKCQDQNLEQLPLDQSWDRRMWPVFLPDLWFHLQYTVEANAPNPVDIFQWLFIRHHAVLVSSGAHARDSWSRAMRDYLVSWRTSTWRHSLHFLLFPSWCNKCEQE